MSKIPLIELRGISRHFTSGDNVLRALDDVSLTIHQGEFVAIMGQSGSGKTTMMNLLGCLDRPTSGSYKLEGVEVAGQSRDERAFLRSKTFGFVYQRYNLLETATAAENVELPAIYAGISKEEREKRAIALLERLGLQGREESKPRLMSGGQQQRVAIARALVNNPPVILADEPTGALDSKTGLEVMELLRGLNAEGRTVILITHDQKVADCAHRQIRLMDGKILSDTRSVEALETPDPPRDERHASLRSDFGEAVKMAIRALRANMFRTLLTLLGIIIGVTSVVVMLAIGDGSKQKVLDQISTMGTNLVMVRPGAPGVRPSGDISTLTMEDAEALKEIPNVQYVVTERSKSMTIRRGNVDATTSIRGTNPAFSKANDWPVIKGSNMSERDYSSMAPVALIGQTVAANLFPHGEDPIGKSLLIKNVPFEVIGLLGKKGASPFGSDQDDVVMIPLSTGTVRLFGKSFLGSITLRVYDLGAIDETQKQVEEIILARHKIADFSVRNMAQFIQMATDTQNTLKILLGAVAAISLFVGGIGVMNIMLVNVTERTREIGVRMATGARTKDILIQFLTEAVVVCVTGGIIGVVFGVLGALASDQWGMRAILSLPPILLSFSCAVTTGVVFGYLPARKAAHLDPVVALAAE